MRYFLIFIIGFFLIGCSTDEDATNSREYITTCYKFVEKGTNVPIVGLSVLIHYGSTGVLSSQGITDNEGVWCFEHWNDVGSSAIPYTAILDDRFYNFPPSLPLNGSLNTIELIPWSRIRFHIINVEPVSETDKIEVTNSFRIDSDGYIYSYSQTRPFDGEDIDAIYFSQAIKGLNTITWSVYSSGNLVSSYSDEVTIGQWGDTIDYEIEY